jgi:hypothetical protein
MRQTLCPIACLLWLLPGFDTLAGELRQFNLPSSRYAPYVQQLPRYELVPRRVPPPVTQAQSAEQEEAMDNREQRLQSLLKKLRRETGLTDTEDTRP